MAGRLFSAIGKLGIGLAVAGSVANTALYNGNKWFRNFSRMFIFVLYNEPPMIKSSRLKILSCINFLLFMIYHCEF